jgi:hypothetical protein
MLQVASFLAAVSTEMYLCAPCSCHSRNIEERNGPGQAQCAAGSPPGKCAAPGDWVVDDGCIGPPTAGTSTFSIFLAEPGLADGGSATDWSEVPSSAGPFAAGTRLVLAFDPQDSRHRRDAELSGVCNSSLFNLPVTPQSDVAVTTQPTLSEYVDCHIMIRTESVTEIPLRL